MGVSVNAVPNGVFFVVDKLSLVAPQEQPVLAPELRAVFVCHSTTTVLLVGLVAPQEQLILDLGLYQLSLLQPRPRPSNSSSAASITEATSSQPVGTFLVS